MTTAPTPASGAVAKPFEDPAPPFNKWRGEMQAALKSSGIYAARSPGTGNKLTLRWRETRKAVQPAHQWDVGYPQLPEPDIAVCNDGKAWIFTNKDVVGEPDAASHGQASSQAGEYPALVCDYCGALTPDPWHSSGMLHGKMSKHIHSCDACASHGQAPAGAAEEIDKALNVYAQAFAARVNGWTRQNGDDLPGARSALFAAIHAYAQASTRPTTSPQADSVQEDAARLDYLHSTGSTIEMLPGEVDFYPMRFRVGGLHSAVSPNLREAIDIARKQGGV